MRHLEKNINHFLNHEDFRWYSDRSCRQPAEKRKSRRMQRGRNQDSVPRMELRIYDRRGQLHVPSISGNLKQCVMLQLLNYSNVCKNPTFNTGQSWSWSQRQVAPHRLDCETPSWAGINGSVPQNNRGLWQRATFLSETAARDTASLVDRAWNQASISRLLLCKSR